MIPVLVVFALVVLLVLALIIGVVGLVVTAVATEIGAIGTAVAAVVGLALYLVATRDKRRAAAARRALRARAGHPSDVRGVWRTHLRGAWDAYDAYVDTVTSMGEGPVAERLRGALDALADSLVEAGALARGGQQLDDAVRGLGRVRWEHRMARIRGVGGARARELERQADEVRRLQQALAQARNGLSAHVVTMRTVAARAAEVAATAAAADADALVGRVDELHDELTALARGVEAARQAQTAGTHGPVAVQRAEPGPASERRTGPAHDADQPGHRRATS